MKTKTMLAVLLVVFAAAAVPTLVSADAGATLQADLTKLSTDVTAAHDVLVPDLGALTGAARAGDRAGVKTAVAKARSDASALLPAVQADRKQLVADVKAARAGGATGLRLELGSAVKADRVVLREIRQARRQARRAVQMLRRSSRLAHA